MAGHRDRPMINRHFDKIFKTVFPVLQTPKTDTRSEEKQEARKKPKKRRDGE